MNVKKIIAIVLGIVIIIGVMALACIAVLTVAYQGQAAQPTLVPTAVVESQATEIPPTYTPRPRSEPAAVPLDRDKDVTYSEDVQVVIIEYVYYSEELMSLMDQAAYDPTVIRDEAWVRDVENVLNNHEKLAEDFRELEPGPLTRLAHTEIVSGSHDIDRYIRNLRMFLDTRDVDYLDRSIENINDVGEHFERATDMAEEITDDIQ